MASSPSSSSTTQPKSYCQCASALVNVANFVSVELHGDKNSNNYRSWKEQMLCLIESQDLLGYIDGEIPPPPPPLPEYAGWRRTDRLVKGWILGALSEEVVDDVVSLESARDVWYRLEKTFAKDRDPPPPPPQAPEPEQDFSDEYLPLYRSALLGDWDTAKQFLDQNPNAIKATVNFFFETSLHVAVGAREAIPFVTKLVGMMSDDVLALQDNIGFNALHVVARTGNTAAATILVDRLKDLLYVQSNAGYFPVHEAAFSAQRETLEFLISETRDDLEVNPYAGQNGVWLLTAVIDAEFFDIALKLVDKYPHMARIEVQPFDISALKQTASKESAFLGEARFNFWERLIYSSVPLEMVSSQVQQATPNPGDIEDPNCSTLIRGGFRMWCIVFQNLHFTLYKVFEQLVPHIKRIHGQKMMHQQALELVKRLCNHMESSSYKEVGHIYVEAMIVAARTGIHEVIEVIVETYPAAIYTQEAATKHRIFDLAVQNRCEKVFNLIYRASDLRHRYTNVVDSCGRNILHLAAGLAPHHKLNQVSGAALQMQREIQWFKEVEKFVHPYARSWADKAGKTPKMVFTEEHKNLKIEGEKWMKDTANSCTIAAALIATVVFAAAITVPGGNKSDTGNPIFSNSAAFIVFAVSDAVSLFMSTTSLLMFLSILTSRYAEEDFLYALPKRLCIGLFTLFVSIFFMTVAFSATLYLVFGRKNALVLIPVAALACLPISSFVLLQFPLLVDVVSSTYGRGIFEKV